MSSVLQPAIVCGRLAVLAGFRREFYDALTARRDELFELADAVLCTDGAVKTLVELALAPEHQRGHGALYDGINHGGLDVGRLRRAITDTPLPRAADGRLVLAVDVSPWLRPDANTSPDQCFCHTYGRGKDEHRMIPGWPYSFVAALESGPTSWTAILDAIRLPPGADVTAITAAQLREVVMRLQAAGHWTAGDPEILIVTDAGYDAPRIAFLLTDLPVQILGRLRSDQVFRRPAPLYTHPAKGGRPAKHGGEFAFGDPATWGEPNISTTTDNRRYGTPTARAWDRLHPILTHRAAWADFASDLPIIEGTVIRLAVDRLPSGGDPKLVWLWWSRINATAEEVDRCWMSFLRRFDIEHTFRLLKQTPGWTAPRLRDPAAADRWTWIAIAAHTQLRLARPLTSDLRRPWEKPLDPERLTPARIHHGFRNLRAKIPSPARAPKPTRPGPGQPPGSRNRQRATIHDVGRVLATGEAYTRPEHHQKGIKPRRKG